MHFADTGTLFAQIGILDLVSREFYPRNGILIAFPMTVNLFGELCDDHGVLLRSQPKV